MLTCCLSAVMPDGVLLPNGKVLIVNGGRTGTAGMLGNLSYTCYLYHLAG